MKILTRVISSLMVGSLGLPRLAQAQPVPEPAPTATEPEPVPAAAGPEALPPAPASEPPAPPTATPAPTPSVAEEEAILARSARLEEERRDAKLPVAFANRSLTLPELVLTPSLAYTYDRGAALPSNLALGAAFGATDWLTFDAAFDVVFDYLPITTTFEAGVTGRFFTSAMVDVGARMEVGSVLGLRSVLEPQEVWLRDTLAIPVVLRIAHRFRLDTGFYTTLILPTDGRTPVDGGFFSAGPNPNVPGGGMRPGIPVRATFNVIEPVFVGFDTGLGIFSFSRDVGDNVFIPMGFRFGGTVPSGKRALVDLTSSFSFPVLFLGGGDSPVSEAWQLGFDAVVYAPL